eukprot:CAMPEP_0168512142 /NCGR_PEP_ID=MMETSP0405-20121227/2584_1 /TAXON_ID=498012 /ORGANISM="Trichosphaerium sp, Strain Am-I-7 wt" /LENGTH=78 /DNA_ID=CAMNT_0008530513 /DNA_START=464 /DNA_END=700 /DNA_ORIENTATION=+
MTHQFKLSQQQTISRLQMVPGKEGSYMIGMSRAPYDPMNRSVGNNPEQKYVSLFFDANEATCLREFFAESIKRSMGFL